MFLLSNLGFYSIVQFSNYSIDLYQKKKFLQFYKYLPAAEDAVCLSFIPLQPNIVSGFAFQTCYGNRIQSVSPSKYLQCFSILAVGGQADWTLSCSVSQLFPVAVLFLFSSLIWGWIWHLPWQLEMSCRHSSCIAEIVRSVYCFYFLSAVFHQQF